MDKQPQTDQQQPVLHHPHEDQSSPSEEEYDISPSASAGRLDLPIDRANDNARSRIALNTRVKKY